MHKITYLSQCLWSRKINEMKQTYLDRCSDMKWYDHFKKVYENNEMYCNVCDKSLKDQIGKNIVINTRSGTTKWYHVECAMKKKLIDIEMELPN